MEIYVLKPLAIGKLGMFFRDVKWCFNASWGLKGLTQRNPNTSLDKRENMYKEERDELHTSETLKQRCALRIIDF